MPAARDAGPATTLSSGFDFTESVAGKPLFRIKAEKTAGFGATSVAGVAPELYAGEGVALTLYPDDGEPVTIHSEKAEYDARTRGAKLEGNVRWTDGKGALAETERVFFRLAERAVDIPGAVHFSPRRLRSEREVGPVRRRRPRPRPLGPDPGVGGQAPRPGPFRR